MPQVPEYSPQEAAPQALPSARMSLDTRGVSGEARAEALKSLASDAQSLGQSAQQLNQAYRDRADHQAVTEAINRWETVKDGLMYDPQSGLKYTKGRDALAASQNSYELLSNGQADIAKELQNDRQRQLFTERTTPLLRETHKEIESHVAEQMQVADVADYEAGKALAAKSVANAPEDEEVATAQREKLIQEAAPLARSPEDMDAHVAQIEQHIASARLNSLISSGKYDKAVEVFKSTKDALGTEAPKFQKEIDNLNESVASAHQTTSIVQKNIVTGEGGQKYPWVDSAGASADVEAMPEDTPQQVKLKDETRQRVEHELAKNEQLKDKAGKEKIGEVLGIYRETGNAFDPRITQLKSWLLDKNNGAQHYWDSFLKELKADSRSQRVSNAEERRAEAERQRTMLEEFRGKALDEQANSDIQKEYLGQGASQLTRNQMKVLQTKAQQLVQKGGLVGEAEFGRIVNTEAQRAGIKAKGNVEALKAFMNNWRTQQLQQNDGKEPPRTEVLKALGQALQYGDSGHWYSTGGFRFRSNEGEAFVPAPTEKQKSPLAKEALSPAPAKAVRAWRYTKDRKQKAPVYSDGSTGPLENN